MIEETDKFNILLILVVVNCKHTYFHHTPAPQREVPSSSVALKKIRKSISFNNWDKNKKTPEIVLRRHDTSLIGQHPGVEFLTHRQLIDQYDH